MWILQISDIHFSPKRKPTLNYNRFVKLLDDILCKTIPKSEPILVAVCGDITFKGQKSGYDLAERFFLSLKDKLSFNTLCFPCPGNHDIIKNEEQFESFNRFSWNITKNGDLAFTSEKSVVSVDYKYYHIVVLNSAYHRDHTYGLVNLDDFNLELSKYPGKPKIVILHHHPIPVEKSDYSTLRNAYEFLTIASENNALVIFHGHRHMAHSLTIGPGNTALIGVGSPFFLDSLNINNQLNILHIDNNKIKKALSFRYIADLKKDGRVGSFDVKKIQIK